VVRSNPNSAARLGEAGEDLHVIGRRRIALGPGHDRPLLEAERLVGDDQLRVEQQLFAQPVAGRAGALGSIEREQPGFDGFEGEAGNRAGELFGEDDTVGREAGALHRAAGLLVVTARDVPIGEIDIGQALGELERLFETVGQPRLDPFAHGEAVDHHLDVVLELLVERGGFLDRV